jgi:hypothetical protein
MFRIFENRNIFLVCFFRKLGYKSGEGAFFEKSMSETLRRLYARRAERGDIVVRCGTKQFVAHLAVLEAECGYFRAMGATLLGSGACGECALESSPDAFERVLECAYSLGLPAGLGMRETLDVLALAVFLDCDVAERAAEAHMASAIDAESALECWQKTRSAGALEASRVATRCVGRSLALVARTRAFLSLSREDVTLLLSADELSVRTERTVASALSAWCEANGELCAPLDGVVRYAWRELPEREKPGVRGIVVLPWDSAKLMLLDEAAEWTELSSLDSPRGRGCGVCHVAGKTYVIGGTAAVVCALGGKWQTYDHRLSRSEVACAFLAGKMFVVGGVLGLCPCWDVDVYHLALGLKGKVYMRKPRKMCCAAATSGALMIAGGIGAFGEVMSHAELFVPDSGWHVAPSMLAPRAAAACATLGSDVYVAGGIGATHSDVDTAERYDAALNAWVALPPMPRPRSRCGGASMAGAFYVLGGLEGGVPATTYLRFAEGQWIVHEASAAFGSCAACFAN